MSQQVAQEKLQQQLSHARAAIKASDSGKAQAEAQQQAQLADLHQQLHTAQQHCTDLQLQHQQDLQQQLASAATTATSTHHQEMETLRSQYTACCHQQTAAMERLQQEFALLEEETDHTLKTVAQEVSALHGGSCSSRAELQQHLRQLREEVAQFQKDSTAMGTGEGKGGQCDLKDALAHMHQQLDAVGCAGIGALLQEHQRLKAQVSCNSTTSALAALFLTCKPAASRTHSHVISGISHHLHRQ